MNATTPSSSPFRALARDIALGGAADVLERPPADVVEAMGCPIRRRFMAACLRLEAAGYEEGAVCRRIYSKSDLADEIALPDAAAAGRIIRVLIEVDPAQARATALAADAIRAVCDLLAGELAGAA